jgi:hypothetical protein
MPAGAGFSSISEIGQIHLNNQPRYVGYHPCHCGKDKDIEPELARLFPAVNLTSSRPDLSTGDRERKIGKYSETNEYR